MAGDRKHLFWAPGQARPPITASLDRAAATEGVELAVPAPENVVQHRLRLPIYGLRRELLYMVESHSVVICVGSTGCGKSTQIPQYLYEAGWAAGDRVVVCTQPRRLAATSLAERVAGELGVGLDEGLIGYAVRFDVRTHPSRTRIKYMTDGMLVREMLVDPLLKRYSVIMVDEAHERAVATDLCLALLKKVQRRRKDLRLIVASATLDARCFAEFFSSGGNAPGIITLDGARTHAVHRCFLLKPCANYVVEAVRVVLDIHRAQRDGDVLVFLTGQQEIADAQRMLGEAVTAEGRSAGGTGGGRSAPRPRPSLVAVPLHGSLDAQAQAIAFRAAPWGARKVVLATNIAETSLTIDGIVYVVDCGFVKRQVFDVRSGQEALAVVPISRAAAKQRAGRAGRTRPGLCYHLFTRESELALASSTPPEVQRCSLEGLVLQLKALGITDLAKFDLPTAPPAAHLAAALELLHALGALDDGARLTEPLGSRMVELPTAAMLSRMILAADEGGCGEEALMVAAMLSVRSVWAGATPAKQDEARAPFAVYEGDHLTLANVLRLYLSRGRSAKWATRRGLNPAVMERAVQVRDQLKGHCRRLGIALESCRTSTVPLRRSIVHGFFPHAARRNERGTYSSLRSKSTLTIHPRSALFRAPPEWVVYHELESSSEADAMVDLCKIDPEWLVELAPHFYRQRTRRGDASVEP